jgi:ABC-type transport system substrate-binding protein
MSMLAENLPRLGKKILSLFLFGSLTLSGLDALAITVPMKDLSTNFDPQKIESIYEMVVDLQIHRSLMRFLPNLSIAPDLAASYEVFDGGKRIRFKLDRRTFSDGTPITASASSSMKVSSAKAVWVKPTERHQ